MIKAVYWYYNGVVQVNYASGRTKKFDEKKLPARVWSFIRTHKMADYYVYKIYS